MPETNNQSMSYVATLPVQGLNGRDMLPSAHKYIPMDTDRQVVQPSPLNYDTKH